MRSRGRGWWGLTAVFSSRNCTTPPVGSAAVKKSQPLKKLFPD